MVEVMAMGTGVTVVNLLLKEVDEGRIRAAKIEAARAGVTLKEWVMDAIESKLGNPRGAQTQPATDPTDWPEEVPGGNDEGGTKSGVRSDHGKTGTAEQGREADLRSSGKEGRGLRQAGGDKPDVRVLRGKVRGPAGEAGAGAVLRPPSEAQPKSSGVDGSAQTNPRRPGVCERPFVDSPHAPYCDCEDCLEKKAAKKGKK